MQKGDTAWKVVEKYTRLGTNLAIYRKHVENSKILELNKLYPLLFPRYRKGKILEADKRTEGFFVFEDRSYAEWFIYKEDLPRDNIRIIRVKLLDTPRRPERVLKCCGASPMGVHRMLERLVSWNDLRPAPKGSWVCHKVEVLD